MKWLKMTQNFDLKLPGKKPKHLLHEKKRAKIQFWCISIIISSINVFDYYENSGNKNDNNNSTIIKNSI